MANPLTTHRAASLERQAWIAKLKREIRNINSTCAQEALKPLLEWGMRRVKRFEKKKGGLGK